MVDLRAILLKMNDPMQYVYIITKKIIGNI